MNDFLKMINTGCCVRMGLLSILLAVFVPCLLSNQMFYFYPGYVGQAGRSPFIPQGPLVQPYSLPLQTNINLNTFSPQSMGNRSTILLRLILSLLYIFRKHEFLSRHTYQGNR